MRALLLSRATLWELIKASGLPAQRVVAGPDRHVALADLQDGAPFDARGLEGRSILIRTRQQLPSVLALIELDGVARRLVLAPPDVSPAHWNAVVAQAEIEVSIVDPSDCAGAHSVSCGPLLAPRAADRRQSNDTEWVLFTSGTTGAPKLVSHTLPGLTGPIAAPPGGASPGGAPPGRAMPSGGTPGGGVWSTFYDVRRYGGLQILLRALLGGGSMVLSDEAEPTPAFLARAGEAGVTHISGTPSHWRRALMSGAAGRIAPGYVRLSGEIADQAVLNRLQAAYPAARVAHAFASTEAGVAFDVNDGLAGFPAALVGAADNPVQLRVADGTLRIRSSRTSRGYLGDVAPLADPDGFVDTGDIVTLRGDRYFFLGRVGGVINVGGRKVHPEEVEAVLNAHPAVLAARVRPRPSPITGALVTAEVVVGDPQQAGLRDAILAACRDQLEPHKVPAVLRIVPALEVTPSGKLARRRA